MSFSIPHLYATGNHYEVGVAMGKTFKERIQVYFNDFHEFDSTILPYITSEKGKKVLDRYLENQKKIFPWYIDEIRGISDGSNIPFDHIFSINLRVEILHIADKENCKIREGEDLTKECSDFHLVNESNFLLAHNEDSCASNYNTGYIVTLKINSSDYNGQKSPNEELTCYCYPAHLPGNAFGCNTKGFVFGVNACYPKLIELNRIPRQFINRAMLSANSLQELENIILNNPISYGVSLNVACCTNDLSLLKTDWNSEYKTCSSSANNEIIYPITWSYEIAPNSDSETQNIVSKHCVIKENALKNVSNSGNYYTANYFNHFNHYDRIKIEEGEVTSSRRRKIRADQLPKATNQKDLLNIVSDTGDTEYPIFREPSQTDTGKTVATVLFNMNTCSMKIYFGKPSGDYELAMQLPLFCKP